MEALIGPIVAAAGSVISEVVELVKAGKQAEAEAKVARFVAATRGELEADKQLALDILERRFKP